MCESSREDLSFPIRRAGHPSAYADIFPLGVGVHKWKHKFAALMLE